MKNKNLVLLIGALSVAAPLALADPAQFDTVVDSARPDQSEDSALVGFALLDEAASNVHGVGAVGRAYSLSGATGNVLWGMVSEAVTFPSAQGHMIGLEASVVSMNPGHVGELRGLDVVFKDRMDLGMGNPVPVLGQNRFNDKSSAIYVSSQPRSGAGEYSGWQAGIRFSRNSLDRSASVPYAAAIDVSEAQVPATFYLIVWRCGEVKCGLKPTADGAEVVRDIDHAP